jgi:hypothetical protein
MQPAGTQTQCIYFTNELGGDRCTELMQQVQGAQQHCIQEHCVCLPVIIELFHMMMMMFIVFTFNLLSHMMMMCTVHILHTCVIYHCEFCMYITYLLPSLMLIFLLLSLFTRMFMYEAPLNLLLLEPSQCLPVAVNAYSIVVSHGCHHTC